MANVNDIRKALRVQQIKEELRKYTTTAGGSEVGDDELTMIAAHFQHLEETGGLKQFLYGDDVEKIHIHNRKTTKRLFDEASARPTDIIYLDKKGIDELGRMWGYEALTESPNISIPTDIIWAKTIPIMDMRLGSQIMTKDGILTKDCTVHIRPNYVELIENFRNSGYEGHVVIGTAKIRFEGMDFEVVIELTLDACQENETEKRIENLKYVSFNQVIAVRGVLKGGRLMSPSGLEMILTQYLAMWYGCELAMLHPITKTIFVEGWEPVEREVHNHTCRPNKKKDNIRRRYVDAETYKTIRKNVYRTIGGKYQRHKTLWWCPGYIRPSTGKFVNGHWRGPDRLLVMKQEELANIVERELYVEVANNGGTKKVTVGAADTEPIEV